MGLALTTVDSVKTFHVSSVIDNTFDTLLTNLIAAVSQQIENYLNTKIKRDTYTEEFGVLEETNKFWLKAAPVTTSSVIVKNHYQGNFDEGATLTLYSDYSVMANLGIVHVTDYALERGFPAVQIQYEGGLVSGATDADVTSAVMSEYPVLARACEMQVLHIFNKRQNLGASSSTGRQGNVNFEPGIKLLDGVIEILDDTELKRVKVL